MTDTARGWLKDLTSLYTPTTTQFDAAKSHRASTEARLDAQLGLHEMFEIGSLRHGTGVWRHSDADYLVSLKGVSPDSPWTMLNKVKETLQQRFTSTDIVIRRPAVVCRFSDGYVEVVPAYEGTSGYWIADPSDGWMKTFPKDHNTYVNTVNKKHDGPSRHLRGSSRCGSTSATCPFLPATSRCVLPSTWTASHLIRPFGISIVRSRRSETQISRT